MWADFYTRFFQHYSILHFISKFYFILFCVLFPWTLFNFTNDTSALLILYSKLWHFQPLRLAFNLFPFLTRAYCVCNRESCSCVAGLARVNCKTRSCGSKWVRSLAALRRKERNPMRSLSRRCEYNLSRCLSRFRIRWARIRNLGGIVISTRVSLCTVLWRRTWQSVETSDPWISTSSIPLSDRCAATE